MSTNSVMCTKSVYMAPESEAFTEGKIYEVFSSNADGLFLLSAINNGGREHVLSGGTEDNMLEYLKSDWFKEHFEFVS